jgi:lactate dehydrogenase-like 2-hydroxyacid dehydrogenase
VSLHVPLTERTRGVIGAAQLSAAMKSTAWLVNTARGPLVLDVTEVRNLLEALQGASDESEQLGLAADAVVDGPPELSSVDEPSRSRCFSSLKPRGLVPRIRLFSLAQVMGARA